MQTDITGVLHYCIFTACVLVCACAIFTLIKYRLTYKV